MSADLKVVSLPREGWREPVGTLRLIADQMESGEIEACSIGAMVMIYESGGVGLFDFGPKAEDLQTLAAFRIGEQLMLDTILDGE
jgi:hypothetical protein